MNVAAQLINREISVDVTDHQLRTYADVVRGLAIAEHQLGNPDLQATLRKVIEDIFEDVRVAVTGVQSLSRNALSSKTPEYYLLKGLRFDELEYSAEQDVRGSFIVGLSSFWGNPALGNYHQPDSRFAYRHVKARPIQPGEPVTLLNSTREGFPHTDSAFKSEPEPLFALFMARAARDGGDSLIWSAKSLVAWIESRPNGREMVELLLTKELPFVGSVLSPEKVIHYPILMNGTRDRIRYKRDAIEDGAKALGRELTTEELVLMDTLDAATEVPELTIRFAMRDGDAVVLDNQRTLHSRSPYSDAERHVLKTTIYER